MNEFDSLIAPDGAKVALRDAAANEVTVTVRREDGQVFTGTPKAHRTDPGYFTIQTGRRGRPAIVHEDDVEEVIAE
jgi:hypothetical protein